MYPCVASVTVAGFEAGKVFTVVGEAVAVNAVLSCHAILAPEFNVRDDGLPELGVVIDAEALAACP